MPLPNTLPTKEAIQAMEPFSGLALEKIHCVATAEDAARALDELMREEAVGFDTESKPTFKKGERSEGPHVLQFATLEKAFLFQAHLTETREAMLELLRSDRLKKVGFDLRGDLRQLSDRFGVKPMALLDLDRVFKRHGFRNFVGARSAIALLLQQRFQKSKSTSTSNWSAEVLSEKQLIYAANDAYAAIRVFHALKELEFSEAS
ncbi:MAG: 3'-5' exonuclease [Luteolibacter sp.]